MLVTVARTWGSSPRPPGSLLAINARGETVGPVSGGCIEDDLVLRLKPDARTAVDAPRHDPKLDDLALIDGLRSDAFYVGAIGSRRNSDQRHARLSEHFGLSHAAQQILRGPAGFYTGSDIPAEVALSVMAEVVAVKDGVRRDNPTPVAMGKAAPYSSTGTASVGSAPLQLRSISIRLPGAARSVGRSPDQAGTWPNFPLLKSAIAW